MYFVQKLGNAILTFVLGLVLELTHFDGNLDVQPASAVTALVASIGIALLNDRLKKDDKE